MYTTHVYIPYIPHHCHSPSVLVPFEIKPPLPPLSLITSPGWQLICSQSLYITAAYCRIPCKWINMVCNSVFLSSFSQHVWDSNAVVRISNFITYTITRVHYNLFIYSPVGGHLYYFQIPITKSKTAMSTCEQMRLDLSWNCTFAWLPLLPSPASPILLWWFQDTF